MMALPRENSAGLICNPTTLDRNRSALRMVLPVSPDDRKGALAALDPDGNLWIFYISYTLGVDPEELIILSTVIDWDSARAKNEFVIDAKNFYGLRLNSKNYSGTLFKKPGIYQFALLTGIDREMLKAKGTPFWVVAGCVVHWQP